MKIAHLTSDDGTNVQIKDNTPDVHESMFFLFPPGHERDLDFNYPVTILVSGNGIWYNDACMRWNGCTMFSIELVTAGNMLFTQNGKSYVVEAGMAYTIRPGTNNEQRPGDKGFVHKRFLHIIGPKLDILREHCGLTESDCVPLSDASRLCSLMRNAARLMRVKPDDYSHQLALLAYDVMITLSLETAGSRYPSCVNAVLHFMNRHLERSVTIDELSAVSCLSRSQLHRVFRSAMSDTPLSYFTKMKIRQAANVLRASPQRTIGDVARQFAFEDQAYFSNLFRKIMGVSPGVFRRNPRQSGTRANASLSSTDLEVAHKVIRQSITLLPVRAQSSHDP